MSDKSNTSAQGALYEIRWTVEKFRNGELIETVQDEGNLLLNAGRDLIYQLISGAGGTPFDAANSVIWVGNGTTPADPAQTGMVGGTTYSKAMEAGFPTVVNGALRFKARFLENQANFAWNEFGVSNGTVMLNRKVQAIGTKTSEDEWVFTVEIRFS